MDRTHFVFLKTSDAPIDFLEDEDQFVFEIEDKPNPFDADDPEVAYHEYLAQRFSR